ncbi:MAG: CopG family antitoxin [Leptolyngbyaceae cyanobacterium]
MDVNRLSSISKVMTDEQMGDFWDAHDFTDFDTDASDIEFEIDCSVSLEMDLLQELGKAAQQRGVKVETLVNLWLRQKLAEQTSA